VVACRAYRTAKGWNTGERMTGKEKPKNSEKSLPQCHSVGHKSDMKFPGIEPGPPPLEDGDSHPKL